MVLSKILGGGSLVETVGKVIDSVHTSEEEKLAAKTKLKALGLTDDELMAAFRL